MSGLLFSAYLIQLLATGFITSTALSHTKSFQTLTAPFVTRHTIAKLGSIVTEYAFFILAAKMFFVYEFSESFNNSSWNYAYVVDVILMLCLWALFLQALFARHPIYENTKFFRNNTSTQPPSLFTLSFWFRFHNPFWVSRSILEQNNIVYATNKELLALAEIDPKAEEKVSLNVYQHPSFPRNRPVVIYIHGGEWITGSKDQVPPLIPYLTLKKYVVVSVNHRLSPNATVVDQLIDIKRAIRWTKQNIVKFGGDNTFISVCGSSSGAHLATMAAMTANFKEYQPDFEDFDTTIQACVSLGGYFDVTHNWGYKFNYKFDHKVVQSSDSDIGRQFSPTWRLKEAQANKARVSATEEEKEGPSFCPFLIIHGKGDALSPIKHVREYKKEFLQTCRPGADITLIELPNANHYFSEKSSPRAHLINYGIEPFLRHQFEKHNYSKSEATKVVNEPAAQNPVAVPSESSIVKPMTEAVAEPLVEAGPTHGVIKDATTVVSQLPTEETVNEAVGDSVIAEEKAPSQLPEEENSFQKVNDEVVVVLEANSLSQLPIEDSTQTVNEAVEDGVVTEEKAESQLPVDAEEVNEVVPAPEESALSQPDSTQTVNEVAEDSLANQEKRLSQIPLDDSAAVAKENTSSK